MYDVICYIHFFLITTLVCTVQYISGMRNLILTSPEVTPMNLPGPV